MSRLWRDQIRIALCPHRVIAARLAPFRYDRLLAYQILEEAHAAWQSAVATLPNALQALGATEADVTVIVSNAYVRYLVLPWSEGLRTDEDWGAFAVHRFTKTFGADTANWSIRLATSDARSARIASAIVPSMIDAITAKVAAAGHRLASVQPYLMTSFNRLRRHIESRTAWIVTHEPCRVTVSLLVDGQWKAVRQRSADETWAQGLSDLLDRETQLVGLQMDGGRVYVDAPELAIEFPTRLGEYSIERPPTPPSWTSRAVPLRMLVH